MTRDIIKMGKYKRPSVNVTKESWGHAQIKRCVLFPYTQKSLGVAEYSQV
jgi:hypothetical protein